MFKAIKTEDGYYIALEEIKIIKVGDWVESDMQVFAAIIATLKDNSDHCIQKSINYYWAGEELCIPMEHLENLYEMQNNLDQLMQNWSLIA